MLLQIAVYLSIAYIIIALLVFILDVTVNVDRSEFAYGARYGYRKNLRLHQLALWMTLRHAKIIEFVNWYCPDKADGQ